jgi:hypothetical protein
VCSRKARKGTIAERDVYRKSEYINQTRKDTQAESALTIYGAWAQQCMALEERKKAGIVIVMREAEYVREPLTKSNMNNLKLLRWTWQLRGRRKTKLECRKERVSETPLTILPRICRKKQRYDA